MFCLIMAGIACLFMPFGTVLGVFTIVVLTRESVREMISLGEGIEPALFLEVSPASASGGRDKHR